MITGEISKNYWNLLCLWSLIKTCLLEKLQKKNVVVCVNMLTSINMQMYMLENMFVCVCVCMYVCMCYITFWRYVYISIYVNLWTCKCVCMKIILWIYVCISICVYAQKGFYKIMLIFDHINIIILNFNGSGL